MKRSWMPLYIADFLADTAHLDSAETGAYLLLIMHYWQHGGLSSDEEKLRRIAKALPRHWVRIWPAIRPFWTISDSKLVHSRIEFELQKSAKFSSQQSEKASKRWSHGINSAYPNGHAKPMPARARHNHKDIKDSFLGVEKSAGAVVKSTEVPSKARTRFNTFNETGTEQWKAWEKHCRDSGADIPEPIPHWETRKLGWYFPSEWPPPMLNAP